MVMEVKLPYFHGRGSTTVVAVKKLSIAQKLRIHSEMEEKKFDWCNEVFVIKVDFCSKKPKMNFRPNKNKYYRYYKSLLEAYFKLTWSLLKASLKLPWSTFIKDCKELYEWITIKNYRTTKNYKLHRNTNK